MGGTGVKIKGVSPQNNSADRHSPKFKHELGKEKRCDHQKKKKKKSWRVSEKGGKLHTRRYHPSVVLMIQAIRMCFLLFMPPRRAFPLLASRLETLHLSLRLVPPPPTHITRAFQTAIRIGEITRSNLQHQSDDPLSETVPL